MESDFYAIARRIFEATKYRAAEPEVKRLAQNMRLVESRGLANLNDRLCAGGRKIWDTVAEHNFAVMLLSHHSCETPIDYEPENGLRKPPDFKVQIDKTTFWVQMKNLAKLERENRMDGYVRKIDDLVKVSDLGLFYSVNFSKEFSQDDIKPLADEILKRTKESAGNQRFDFPSESEPIAQVEIWQPQRSCLKHLTLGMYGDFDFVEETQLAADQIRNSFAKAAQAFDWSIDEKTVNLIAMDATLVDDIDLCDAAFGTEHDVIGEHHSYWKRDNDGFFITGPYVHKVAAIITLKRRERSPISGFFSRLFISPRFQDRLEQLSLLLDYDRVIYRDMRPIDGSSEFEIHQE